MTFCLDIKKKPESLQLNWLLVLTVTALVLALALALALALTSVALALAWPWSYVCGLGLGLGLGLALCGLVNIPAWCCNDDIRWSFLSIKQSTVKYMLYRSENVLEFQRKLPYHWDGVFERDRAHNAIHGVIRPVHWNYTAWQQLVHLWLITKVYQVALHYSINSWQTNHACLFITVLWCERTEKWIFTVPYLKCSKCRLNFDRIFDLV